MAFGGTPPCSKEEAKKSVFKKEPPKTGGSSYNDAILFIYAAFLQQEPPVQFGGQGCGQLGPHVWVTCAFLAGALGFEPLAKAVVLSANSPIQARLVIYFISINLNLNN